MGCGHVCIRVIANSINSRLFGNSLLQVYGYFHDYYDIRQNAYSRVYNSGLLQAIYAPCVVKNWTSVIYTSLFTNFGSMHYKQTNMHIQTNKQDAYKISNMSNET